jgi:hypothetical protein
MVLEPLGCKLLQQQHAARQGWQPPSLLTPAAHLSVELPGGTTLLLQAMLTVCLHQLVLHAERTHGWLMWLRASGAGTNTIVQALVQQQQQAAVALVLGWAAAAAARALQSWLRATCCSMQTHCRPSSHQHQAGQQ